MIIFLYGQDTYRAKKKLKEIIEHYQKVHKSGLNFRFLDLAEKTAEEFEDFKDNIRQASMFKEKKLQILSNPFSNSFFKEKFLERAEDFIKSEDIIVLFQEDGIKKNDKLFKFLKKKAKCQEFNLLGGRKLYSWVKDRFEKEGFKVKEDVLEKLISFVGNDLWRMENEILKLTNYRKRGKIKKEDVELLVRPEIETDIFKTIDAIAQRDKKKALSLLYKHLGKGDNPLYLLSMISYQFRNVLQIKELIDKHKPYNIILKKSGLCSFVARKSYYQARKFSLSELKKIYHNIFQADLDIKTGKIESETAIDLFIATV